MAKRYRYYRSILVSGRSSVSHKHWETEPTTTNKYDPKMWTTDEQASFVVKTEENAEACIYE